MTAKRTPPRRGTRARRARSPSPRSRAAKPPLSRHAAEQKVIRALRTVLTHVPPEAIQKNAALVNDLGVDSLKVAELSIALEEAFERPVFLGEVFARVDDPSRLNVSQVAAFLARDW